MTEEKNEFDSLDDGDMPPTTAPSSEPNQSPIASGSAGMEYDWKTAPEGVKAPPRENLDGQELVIKICHRMIDKK